ncbi:helix-turn-helix domain-containing protein [Alkalihalobacillus sp. LMS39]|uniref:helix-turn-helix domain-containing protein n=1 Tax=Alkalihalobacillus sp. LMS39 TaxID=2924032 RepID=UPI001FB386EF|nr:helix-turn-helix domain-containing protein [Alkalihalobacillus sp. LMS39]UOE92392.1 helix-turn-helix domain-containing protein [Alkalihalobacillus sp. LMS39]
MIPVMSQLILYILYQFNGNRSIYGVYHLLKGKRSAQTIQDGHLFRCLFLFGIIPSLTREQTDKSIQHLESISAVSRVHEERFVVTKLGESIVRQFQQDAAFFHHIDGWKYKEVDMVFWYRLTLFIQCLSFMVKKESKFIPITNERHILQWVRQSFPRNQEERKKQLNDLYKELLSYLVKIEEINATIVVKKLTGATQIGLTNEQLAFKYKLDKEWINLRFLATVHQLLKEIETEPNQYPMLSRFYEKNRTLNVTSSTKQTYDLLQQGKSIQQIAEIRQLKENTIEDHIVEIAIEDQSFSISSFVGQNHQLEIERLSRKEQTKRLRDLKDKLDDDISYFQIRLVLSRMDVES